MVAAGGQLELASGARVRTKTPARADASLQQPSGRAATPQSIDLHGKTVDEALEALELFINHALLEGSREVRVIHGRSGGRIKAAVHGYLRQLPAVEGARLDPHNQGVTIVRFY